MSDKRPVFKLTNVRIETADGRLVEIPKEVTAAIRTETNADDKPLRITAPSITWTVNNRGIWWKFQLLFSRILWRRK